MNSRPYPRHDAGMTLIELVVTIAVIGAITTVLAAAVTVTFRQQSDTQGNLNIARWEQALALWLPTDLASAPSDTLDLDPAAPAVCDSACDGTSNALTLTFDDGSGPTTVSYRYGPDSRGDGYVLIRVECRGGSCSSRTILRDLARPTAGWEPGVSEVPGSVISVAAPNGGGGSSGDNGPVTVSVTVNGLPDAGDDTRTSTVTVTAGGLSQPDLDLPSFDEPEFGDARSACGGPVTLLVDDSKSVFDDVGSYLPVRQGVESFVRAFEGTATDLTVIRFSSFPSVLGAGGNWTRSYDLSEPSEVLELVGDATPGVGGRLGEIGQRGGTDWREALERAYLDENDVPYSDLGIGPEMVVFFTDGLPVQLHDSPWPRDPAYTGRPTVVYPDGSSANLAIDFPSWDSARHFLDQHRDTARIIGVGISRPFEEGIVPIPFADQSRWASTRVPAAVFLGDLVAGVSEPSAYTGSDNFELAQYDPATGWGDVSTAHLMTTRDMNRLGEGLAAIALTECGGVLTVQTRDQSGDRVRETVTYQVGNEQARTSRTNKTATFEFDFATGQTVQTVDLFVQDLAGTGINPTGWSCQSGGVDRVQGTDWDYISPGDPGAGITVEVTSAAAISCKLIVS